jgi:hypothetical protein
MKLSAPENRGKPRVAGLPLLSLFRIAAMLIACAAAPGPGVTAECQGRIGAETAINGRTDYDPFSPVDIADDYRISIANAGAEPCSFGLLFRAKTARPQLGDTLAYNLAAQGASSLLTNAPPAMAPLARLKSPLDPSATGSLEFQLIIPRGQFAAPGVYRDTVELELYALDAGGRATGSALQAATLAIAYTVPRVLSVNLKGGELATTVSFGALAKGQQGTVEIQARGNQLYRLDVSSDNRGALALTPKPPGQDWTVPYMATLSGQPLNLTGGASLRNLPPTRPESDASHPLTITIGETGQKRAGRYEDVITIEIMAAAP